MSRPQPEEQQGLLIRLLSIPLLPFVAAWELLKALPRFLSWLLGLLARLVVTVVGWLIDLIRFTWRVVTWPLVQLERGLRWAAVRAWNALFPLLLRLFVLLWPIVLRVATAVREVVRALLIALRALAVRLWVAVRIAARALWAVLVRVGVFARAVARAGWIGLVWLLRPVGRALRLLWRGVTWPFRMLWRAAAWLVTHAARIAWTWLLAPLGRLLRAGFQAARSLLLWVASGVAAFLAPAVLLAWRALAAIGAVIGAAARLAWHALVAALSAARRGLVWLLRPLVLAVRAAYRTIADAASTAGHAVRLSVRAARNSIRAALGRPPLPVHAEPRTVMRPAPTPRIGARLAFQGTVAVFIVAALAGIGLAAYASRPTSPARTTASSPREPTEATVECPFLLPGGPLTADGPACGDLKVGRASLDFDCAQHLALTKDVTTQEWDQNNAVVKEPTPVRFEGGTCRFTTPAGHIQDLATGTMPRDSVTVIDFVAPATGLYHVGADARCGGQDCVSAFALSEGSTQLWEWLKGRWVIKRGLRWNMKGGEANRIVLWVAGDKEVGWLNGQSMGDATVLANSPAGYGEFFVFNESTDATVQLDLNRFAVLALGS